MRRAPGPPTIRPDPAMRGPPDVKTQDPWAGFDPTPWDAASPRSPVPAPPAPLPPLPVLALFPALVGIVAYLLSVLHGGFVYDDGMIIADNKFVREIGNLPKILDRDSYYGFKTDAPPDDAPEYPKLTPGSGELSYRPLETATHILETWFFWESRDRHLWTGYRLGSLFAHALNALLVFAVAWRVARAGLAASLVAGCLFALHPVATEAVAVASFREDVMCLFFLLLSVLSHVAGVQARGPRSAWLAALTAGLLGLALLSKEVGFVGPVLLLAADALFARPRPWERGLARPLPEAARYGALVAVAAAYAVLRFAIMKHPGEATPWPGASAANPKGSLLVSCLTMVPVFADYLRLYAFPLHLRADYMAPIVYSAAEPRFAMGLFVLASAAFLGLAAGFRSRPAALGLLLLALGLAPVSNVVPIVNIEAERYLYVPLAGVALAAGAGAGALRRRALALSPSYAAVADVSVCVLLLALGVRTWLRLPVWNNNDTLWRATAEDEPLSTRAQIGLSANLIDPWLAYGGKTEGSEKDWREAQKHLLAIVSTPQRAPRPGDEKDASLWVDLYSDGQWEMRRSDAYRFLSQGNMIEFERARDRGEPEPERYLHLAQHFIEEAIKLKPGARDLYETRGKAWGEDRAKRWRRFWSARDRGFAADEGDMRLDEALRHYKEAAALTSDGEYLASLAWTLREQIRLERWLVLRDVASVLGRRGSPGAAKDWWRAAAEDVEALRLAGLLDVRDRTRWDLLEQVHRETGRPDWPGTTPVEPDARWLPKAAPPNDRKAALDEALRLSAAGEPRAAAAYARWALGDDAPGRPEEASWGAPWIAAYDLVRLRRAADESPREEEVARARNYILKAYGAGDFPLRDTWQSAFNQWQARLEGVAQAQQRLRVISTMDRAVAFLEDPLFREVHQEAGSPEADRILWEAWRIHYDRAWHLWEAGLKDRARRDYQAAIEAAERAEAAGRMGAGERRTWDQLAESADRVGDSTRHARYKAKLVELGFEAPAAGG
ncbi:MAG: phospholipid carrier-dependent glycosyltransferase [Planctomycetales bacterium]|nr:phospholipid carrier-dependent glycosyltransferase [Planctomycetales bacterium]